MLLSALDTWAVYRQRRFECDAALWVLRVYTWSDEHTQHYLGTQYINHRGYKHAM